MSMACFVPAASSSSVDNEFGPGMYAGNSFDDAKNHAGPNGAILVFKQPDYQDLNVWKPTLDEWNRLVACWLELPLQNVVMPPKFRTADVIIGPTSADQHEARKKKRFAKQNSDLQSVFVTCLACDRLRSSLFAIIYVEN